jgi:hypothetical protein
LSLGIALTTFPITDVSAQEKCKVSGQVPAANTTFTQQHVLDARDVPGHQVRIYELHRTYPNDEPNCEGLKRVEQWVSGYSDYTDRNGRTWGYTVTVFDNGDKIFGEFDGTSHTITGPDGSKKSTYTGVTRYTGGTGKYQAVRGLVRENNIFDPEKKLNQSQYEGEYWFEK